jgi:Fe-S oxidoreductase
VTETTAPFQEGIELIKEAGGASFKLCYQCGLCDAVCPLNLVKSFLVTKIVRQAYFGLSEIENDEIWQCTTCLNCTARCPRGVEITDIITSVRKLASEHKVLPQTIRSARRSLSGEGNPWTGKRQERGDWVKGLAVKPFTEGTEVLFFPCCTPIYDSKTRKIASATVNILNKAGVDFGILGPKENCCGESIRRAGEEELYKRLAKENIKAFVENGVKKILLSSPHCYHTFKNEYPEFKVNFEVIHISQYLAELIDEGRLEFNREYRKKVTYHDPCYLGRHNRIYDEPRMILKHVPGLELVEMADSWEDSLCCGGGGGRIWMETPKAERLSSIRLQQAIDNGATVLATFCPYCVINFEDSRLNLEDSGVLEIKDVTEIIQEAV